MLHKNFQQFQANLPSSIKPQPRREGNVFIDRVPEFIRESEKLENIIVTYLKIGKKNIEIENVHVHDYIDPDGIYADMRGYRINGELLFVFSKGATIAGSEPHIVAKDYLQSLIQQGLV